VHTRYAAQRLLQLSNAQQCVELDARPVTVQRLTGLRSPDLHRWFFRHPEDAHRGRAPCATQWYQGANLLQRIDASLVTAFFHRFYIRGFSALDALLSAYRGYQELGLPDPRVDFDRAFDLAAHTAGIWLTQTPRFAVVTCPTCTSESLTDYGRSVPLGCPFCQLLERHSLDPRVQLHFSEPTLRKAPPVTLGITLLCRHAQR
jgi:flagellar transcriptional activator FlhC